MKILQEKLSRYDAPQKAKAAGVYPYFRAISSEQDTEVMMHGRKVLMFGSNSYMGLTNHPKVIEAAVEATRKFGTGMAGSPFLNGTLEIHKQLEARLAEYMGKEDAMIYSTGFGVNLGVVSTLTGREDYIILDEQDHASIIEGRRLSFSNYLKYRHNDMDSLEKQLQRCEPDAVKLIVTDSVFSMEGDVAHVDKIVELAKKYNATVMLDLLATCAVILSLSAIIPCWTAVATIIIRCAAQLYTHSQEPMRRLGTSLVIITTMGVGLGTMLAMAEAGKVVLAVLFFIWINDTGAYCVGSLFGRHKLFVRISPNKTWEGFLGGLLLCVGASVIFCHCLNGWFAFLPQPHYWQWATIACATVLFATWGDLVESLAKRSLGVKDSGRLIPGHGGILDRIDSLLMAMPAIWCIMKIFNLL